MTWFLIAITATICWAFANIIDGYIVKKHSVGHHGSGGLVLFTCIMGILMALCVGIFTKGLFSIPTTDKIFLLLTGGLTIGWIILYLYTLEIEDVSSVAPWFLTIPIFGYVLSYIFLGETLTLHQGIGSLIIILGMSLVLIDFSGQKKKFKWKPAMYMLLASFMAAISGVIFKYVTVESHFWISSFWEYIGLGSFGVFVYFFIPTYRHQFHSISKNGGRKVFILNSMSEITSVSGNLLSNYAILLAPVTMVYLVGSFQPAIVLIFTLIGTHFTPHITKENLTRHIIIPKIIAIIITIIGSVFLFI